MRTNFFQRRRRPACRSRYHRHQVRQPQGRRHAAAAAAASKFLSARRGWKACICAFGKVARGGIRWSDRPQDFRTEILGLVKAQQVKNAVIVPVGAKGGFVPKRLPPATSARPARPRASRSIGMFMAACSTSPTNHRRAVVPPRGRGAPRRRRSLSGGRRRQGHRDIFRYRQRASPTNTASGSTTPSPPAAARLRPQEDGITARGAWEAVKRHFREMDVDIQSAVHAWSASATCRATCSATACCARVPSKLVAAFDHRDIFIDPDPDPAASFAERKRLFDLPRSSWQDYDQDPDLARRRRVFRARPSRSRFSRRRARRSASPRDADAGEVISAILEGAGRSAVLRRHRHLCARQHRERRGGRRPRQRRHPRHGAELRCKVIGEGANLGMTQRGRIEAALRGVRLNTDAIDNSAGVNTSDVEVNLKIALSLPMHDGRLTWPDRNALLAQHDRRGRGAGAAQQLPADAGASRSTSSRGLEDLGFQQRLMQTLEQRSELDRAVEFLPDDSEIAERRRRGDAAHPARDRGAARLREALAPRRSARLAGARRSVSRARARPYFPPAVATRFPDAVGAASAAPRHHRDPAWRTR